MNDLRIEYAGGSMTFHLDSFFPTSQARVRKLMKVIELDREHEWELKEFLKAYLKSTISKHGELWRTADKNYMEQRQRVLDTETLVNTRKHPNGIQLTAEELKSAKEDLRRFKAEAKHALSEFNLHKRKEERLKSCLEIVILATSN